MPAVPVDHLTDLAASNLFYRRPELYDQVQADPSHTVARRVEQAVATHAPAARTLLDLGCGTGRDLEALARRFSCIGVDLQPELIAYARRVRPELDVRVGDMRGIRLGGTVDVVTCLGNSLSYIDEAELAAAFPTFAAHAHTSTLLIIATLTEPVQAATRTHRVDTTDLHAEVTISYTWDPHTGINTMLRRWRTDAGTIHEDRIRRRVRSAGELDRHAETAGFALADGPRPLSVCTGDDRFKPGRREHAVTGHPSDGDDGRVRTRRAPADRQRTGNGVWRSGCWCRGQAGPPAAGSRVRPPRSLVRPDPGRPRFPMLRR